MTNAILRGKPDAGNPHVRFDEGEVASAKPRRGTLLYKKIVVLGAAMLSLSVMLDAFSNPLVVEAPPRILNLEAITVENCAEIGKAVSKVSEGLNELKTLLEKDSGSLTNQNHIFIYRAGRRYSFDVRDMMLLRGYDNPSRLSLGFDYCWDDLYFVDGQIVPGRALIEKLIEKCRSKSIRGNRRGFTRDASVLSKRGVSFIACCIKEGKEKIVDEMEEWRKRQEKRREEEERRKRWEEEEKIVF